MSKRDLSLKVFLLLFCTSLLFAQNKINFLHVNFPPLWIIDGSLKGKGIADAGETFIKKELPNFSYNTIEVTVARAQSFMSGKNEKTYCAVPHGKGFFENVVESKVWVAISGHVLVSTPKFISNLKSNQKVLNDKNQLVLKEFLRMPNNIGLVTKEQRYPIVDTFITPHRGTKIKDLVSTDMLSLYDMVLKQRADYTFQYESTVMYLQKLGFDMKFITLEELNDHKVLIVVGCNDTPVARKFIAEIDERMDGLRTVGLQKMEEYHSDITFDNIKDFVPQNK